MVPQEFLIVDTETTRAEPKGEIVVEPIEVGYVLVRGAEVAGSDRKAFKPIHPITAAASATHFIVDSDLVGNPPSSSAPECLPECEFWVGHNIDFDWRVLGSPGRIKRIDTLAMAKWVWPGFENHKLTTLVMELAGDKSIARDAIRGAHSALYDCLLVYDYLLPRLGRELGFSLSDPYAMWGISQKCRVPKVLSSGKHKGKTFAEVEKADRGYLRWILNSDMDEWTKVAARKALG